MREAKSSKKLYLVEPRAYIKSEFQVKTGTVFRYFQILIQKPNLNLKSLSLPNFHLHGNLFGDVWSHLSIKRDSKLFQCYPESGREWYGAPLLSETRAISLRRDQHINHFNKLKIR